MQPPLVGDNLWSRRGISLLWDPDQLNDLCSPNEIISIRQLRQLHDSGWPEEKLPLVRDKAIVVAGLDACIDALSPETATEWLETVIYPLNVSFQREVADGGGQAALVFWLVELSRCLFNGAQRDLKEIHDLKGSRLGLYHPRIS